MISRLGNLITKIITTIQMATRDVPGKPHLPSRVILPKIVLPTETSTATPTSAGDTDTARSFTKDPKTLFVATARTRKFYSLLSVKETECSRNLVEKLSEMSSDPEFLALSSDEHLDFCIHLLMHLQKTDLKDAPKHIRRAEIYDERLDDNSKRKVKKKRRVYKRWKNGWFKRMRAVSIFISLHCVDIERVLPLLRDIEGRLDHALIWLIQHYRKHASYEAALRRILPYTPLTLKSILSYKGYFAKPWYRRALRFVGKKPFEVMAAQRESVKMFHKPRYGHVASWIVNN